MELEKQKLLVSYLLSSQELFTKVNPILKSAYFDVKIKPLVTFVKKYFDEYKVPPVEEQVQVETGQSISVKSTLTRQELSYAEKELETFCKEKAIEHAILSSPKLLEEGRYGDIERLIKEAITVSTQKNMGIDYFQDPEARLKMLSLNQNMVPTKWTKLDRFLGGGINRKEMIIFAAPPGVGKSLTMGNLARNLLKQGLNGAYITLELSEEVTAKRFDSMFSGIGQSELLKNITKASVEIKKQASEYGQLFIKRMPESSTNANHIRAYLKEFEINNGFVPDFLVVDYLDLMASCQGVSAENMFVKDKYVSEELRAIANEYNLMMITASQLNRGAQQLENIDDLSQANIAGGISKVNTTDNLVAIIQTAQMKARGEMLFKLLKTRSSNGVGNYYILKMNPVTLVLENLEEDEEAPGAANTAKLKSMIQENRPSFTPSGPTGSSGIDINNLPFQV